MLLILPVVGFLAGRASAWPAGALAFALRFAGIVASQLIDLDGDDIVPEFMLTLALYLAALALHGREAVAGRLAAQADEFEAERDAYARLSVRYEAPGSRPSSTTSSLMPSR
jgi:hypothetical protein